MYGVVIRSFRGLGNCVQTRHCGRM